MSKAHMQHDNGRQEPVMWIPSEDWIEGALCGAECYKQLAILHKSLTEQGLQQIAEAYGEEFYPTDEQKGHEFVDGFLHGYAGGIRLYSQCSGEEDKDTV